MAVLFADVPEALASTIEVAERCSFRRHAQADPAALYGRRRHQRGGRRKRRGAELRRQADEG